MNGMEIKHCREKLLTLSYNKIYKQSADLFMNKRLHIFTDGGARGNPGPAGAGAVLFLLDKLGQKIIVAEISRYVGKTTNNQAEYLALIFGLNKALELGYKQIDVYMDSELIVKQMRGEYRVKDMGLKERHRVVLELVAKLSEVTFTHVRREQNKQADALVNRAIDSRV